MRFILTLLCVAVALVLCAAPASACNTVALVSPVFVSPVVVAQPVVAVQAVAVQPRERILGLGHARAAHTRPNPPLLLSRPCR